MSEYSFLPWGLFVARFFEDSVKTSLLCNSLARLLWSPAVPLRPMPSSIPVSHILFCLVLYLSFCLSVQDTFRKVQARLSFEYTHIPTHTAHRKHISALPDSGSTSRSTATICLMGFHSSQGESFYHEVKEKKIKRSALNLWFIMSVTSFWVYIRQRQVSRRS